MGAPMPCVGITQSVEPVPGRAACRMQPDPPKYTWKLSCPLMPGWLRKFVLRDRCPPRITAAQPWRTGSPNSNT